MSTGQPQIGPRIRRARRERQMTIEQVAVATGLTKGFLSQVERDLAQTSVASLVRICDVLDLPIGSLFEATQTNFVSREGKSRVHLGGHGIEEYLLSASSEKRLQVIETIVQPGGGTGSERYAFPAKSEFVHVLIGQLSIAIGDETLLLNPGDSLTFAAQEDHIWSNPGDVETHAIWVFSPAVI